MARYQSNRASCGPAALCNALAALSIQRTEDELIKLTGQKPEGTGVKGMLKAIHSISTDEQKMIGDAIKWRQEAHAFLSLWYNVSALGRPVILCVDAIDHWVACVGHLGPLFTIIDSADNRLVLHYHWHRLRQRWAYKDGYYGIVV